MSGGGVRPPGVGGPGNWSDGNASGSGPGVGGPGNWNAGDVSGGGDWSTGVGPSGNWSARTTGYDDKTPITTQPVANTSKGIEEKRFLKISFLKPS